VQHGDDVALADEQQDPNGRQHDVNLAEPLVRLLLAFGADRLVGGKLRRYVVRAHHAIPFRPQLLDDPNSLFSSGKLLRTAAASSPGWFTGPAIPLHFHRQQSEWWGMRRGERQRATPAGSSVGLRVVAPGRSGAEPRSPDMALSYRPAFLRTHSCAL